MLTLSALLPCWCIGADESYEQNAEREIEEEMGVRQVKLNPCFDFYHEDEISRLWGRLFTCTYDGEFQLDPEEVESGKFMSVQVSASAFPRVFDAGTCMWMPLQIDFVASTL